AVERAFLNDAHVKAVRIRVDRAGAHAPGGALAAYDQAADAEQAEMRQERRSLEDAGALLVDDDVRRLGREGVIDAVILRVGRLLLAPRGDCAVGPVLRPMVLGAVENRNAGTAHRGEQALGRLDRAMRKDAATVRILRVEIDGSARTAAVDEIVEI